MFKVQRGDAGSVSTSDSTEEHGADERESEVEEEKSVGRVVFSCVESVLFCS